MNASEILTCYVADVARELPRRMRNDVAFELQALLQEELAAKAEDTGRAPDAALAMELLQAFGAPSEVAQRYQPALTLIDPVDGPRFLRATWIGLGVIWGLGLLAQFRTPSPSGWDLLRILQGWWGGVVLPSFWWPGVLVAGFGLAAWARRRWPRESAWKPRAEDRLAAGRVAQAFGLLGILAGVWVLSAPGDRLMQLSQGAMHPAVREIFAYTDAFRTQLLPWLLLVLGLHLPLGLAALVQGRRSALVRGLSVGVDALAAAVMLLALARGPVFQAQPPDRAFRAALLATLVYFAVHYGLRLLRQVRPQPEA